MEWNFVPVRFRCGYHKIKNQATDRMSCCSPLVRQKELYAISRCMWIEKRCDLYSSPNICVTVSRFETLVAFVCFFFYPLICLSHHEFVSHAIQHTVCGELKATRSSVVATRIHTDAHYVEWKWRVMTVGCWLLCSWISGEFHYTPLGREREREREMVCFLWKTVELLSSWER